MGLLSAVDPLWLFRKNLLVRRLRRVVSAAASQQAGGNSIEHNDSPDRADQKENFSNNDIHAIPLTCFIALKLKELESKSLIQRSVLRAKVFRKNADLN